MTAIVPWTPGRGVSYESALEAEVEALRTLIANARVEEHDDTEWFCPRDRRWVDCPGVDGCEHDQSRTVIRRVLAWRTETRFESEVLGRAWRGLRYRRNQVQSAPADNGSREGMD